MRRPRQLTTKSQDEETLRSQTLLEMGCVGKTPASCAEAEPDNHTCFAHNLSGACPNALPWLRGGRALHVFATKGSQEVCEGFTKDSYLGYAVEVTVVNCNMQV